MQNGNAVAGGDAGTSEKIFLHDVRAEHEPQKNSMSEYIASKKELAAKLGRHPRFVGDMERGGFRLPSKLETAVKFLRENPHPTRYRQNKKSR